MTPLDATTLDFVRGWIERFAFSPTNAEIAEHFGITSVAAHYRVERLVEAGFLRKTRATKRGLELVDALDLRTASSARLRAELARRGEMIGALSVPERRTMARRAVTCASDGCDIEVRPGHLMCLEHWRALPHDMRGGILRAHAAARASRDADDVATYGELVRQARERAGKPVTGGVAPRLRRRIGAE